MNKPENATLLTEDFDKRNLTSSEGKKLTKKECIYIYLYKQCHRRCLSFIQVYSFLARIHFELNNIT